MTRDEYNKARRKIISARKGLKMAVLSNGHKSKDYQAELQARFDALPETPPKLPDVFGFEITDAEGGYAGFTRNESDARQFAADCKGTIKRRIAQNVGHLSI